MKDIRKHIVESCDEIVEYLCKKEPERAAYFIDKIDDIGNDELVKDFWNMLVECKKHNKFLLFKFKKMSDENELERWNMTDDMIQLAFWSYVLTSSIKYSYHDLYKIASTLGIGAVGLDVYNKIYHLHKYEDAAEILEGFRIREPELLDIELCFNKVDMEQVKTTGDISKKAYREAHKVWLNYLNEKGIDLTNGDIKFNDVGKKLNKSLDKVYQEEYELVK